MKTPKDPASLFREVLSYRSRTQETRVVQLLTAAIDLLAEKGVDEVTFESVGKRAKMNRSHVVYYFKSRDELIDSALEFVAYSAQRIIATDLLEVGSGDELLENYISANFRWLELYPKHANVMLLIHYEASFKKRRRDFNSEIRETGKKRIEAILRLSPRLENLKGPKREALTRAIQALITGNLVDSFSTNAKSLETMRKETVEMAQHLVRSFE